MSSRKPLSYHRPLAGLYPIAVFAGVTDFLLIVAGSYIAHYLRFGDWGMLDFYLVATFVIGLVVVGCQVMMGSYLSWRGRYFFRQMGRFYTGWLLALAVIAAAAVLLKVSGTYSRIWLVTTVGVAVGLATFFRLVMYAGLRYVRTKGHNLKKVVVVEAGSAAANLHARMPILHEHGYHIGSVLQLQHSDDWLVKLERALVDNHAHELWLCLPLEQGQALKTILRALRHQMVDIRYLPIWAICPCLITAQVKLLDCITWILVEVPCKGQPVLSSVWKTCCLECP